MKPLPLTTRYGPFWSPTDPIPVLGRSLSRSKANHGASSAAACLGCAWHDRERSKQPGALGTRSLALSPDAGAFGKHRGCVGSVADPATRCCSPFESGAAFFSKPFPIGPWPLPRWRRETCGVSRGAPEFFGSCGHRRYALRPFPRDRTVLHRVPLGSAFALPGQCRSGPRAHGPTPAHAGPVNTPHPSGERRRTRFALPVRGRGLGSVAARTQGSVRRCLARCTCSALAMPADPSESRCTIGLFIPRAALQRDLGLCARAAARQGAARERAMLRPSRSSRRAPGPGR